MAKSEILMWVAGIMMMLILGLVVAPTISKSSNSAKIAVINSEISSIRNAAILQLSRTNTGTFTGVTATSLADFLPGLELLGGKLVSKVHLNVLYSVEEGSTPESLKITLEGLTVIEGSEDNIKISQTPLSTTMTDTSVGDGILIFDFKI